MKTKWIEKEMMYDGTQLSPLFAYLNYEVLGDSIISWAGPCDIPDENILDGEDLLLQAQIKGGHMLHFIVEKFQSTILAAVSLQRLLSSLCLDLIKKESSHKEVHKMYRKGDDIYLNDQKLCISVATQSVNSSLIHFAININNEDTPVKTISLEDLKLPHKDFAEKLMTAFSDEVESILVATQKVRCP